MHDYAAVNPSGSVSHVRSRSLASAATWQLLALVSISISILFGSGYFWGFLEYDFFIPQTVGNKHSMETTSSHDVPQMLGRIHVSISFHYTVERLHILYENLETISRWETIADVCIGTNAPEKVLVFLQSPPLATEFTRKVAMCPVQNLTTPTLLNWRTRESMERAFLSPLNYTAFIFVEDDLYVTWEALLKWEEDTQILQHHNFMRTFFRYEFSPLDGQLHSLDYQGQGTHRVVTFPPGDDDRKDERSFVQLGGATTYSGMFIATRGQLSRFIASEFWSCKYYFCMFYITFFFSSQI
jgi:hypothetical protein